MIEDRAKDWFVANVSELRWQENELGATCEFDKHRERFDGFGINLTVLRPRQPMTMYHRERYQEGFLVLRGECLLIVEGREVPLRQWDYFHCPGDVAHAIVGSGDGLACFSLILTRRRKRRAHDRRQNRSAAHRISSVQQARPAQSFSLLFGRRR